MKRVMAVFIAVGLGIGIYSITRDSGYTCSSSPVLVSQGDTITSIVHAHCEGNTRRAIDDTYEIYGSLIIPSQQIYLPSSK